MTNLSIRTLFFSLGVLSLSSGCSVLYESQRHVAASACLDLPTADERSACRKQSDIHHAQYEKQRADVRDRGTEKKVAPQNDPGLCFKRESTGEYVCPN